MTNNTLKNIVAITAKITGRVLHPSWQRSRCTCWFTCGTQQIKEMDMLRVPEKIRKTKH